MAITIPRYRILPLRGTYAALLAEINEINDNEICYAIDQDQYYQKEGNVLVQVGATKVQGAKADTAVQPVDLGPVAFSNSYQDLDDKPNVVEVGDNVSLLANNVGYVTSLVAGQTYVKYTDSLGVLADVDLSTTAPVNGNALVYDGTNWVPGVGGGGDVEEAPLDGAYYVRQNGQWVNEDEVLLYRYVINADGGDFETGEARGAFVTLDPGDFDTGVSNGIDQTVDGGIFT